MRHHAQTPLDMGEVLVVLAEDKARELVVFEGEADFRGFREALAGGGAGEA